MRIIVYSSKSYDEATFNNVSFGDSELTFTKPRLDASTALLAEGHDGVCVFVNDVLDRDVLTTLHGFGIRFIALRCAGFNNVDLDAARELGFTVGRVPEYSPYSVAEHTVGLMLGLNRRLCRAFNRVREGNFALDGLLGFDMYGRTVGVVGTGKIGAQVCRILLGMGCKVLGYDKFENTDLASAGVKYVSLDEVLEQSHIVTLHCPLTPETHHMINDNSLERMKPGVMLINTSRGALLDTRAVLQALKSGHIGYLGMDVYEEEADLFFEDRSADLLQDDQFARLLTFPNVMITGHQAFFTKDALAQIALVTSENIRSYATSKTVPEINRVV